MTPTLHIINHAASHPRTQLLLETLEGGDRLLLIENGVTLALCEAWLEKIPGDLGLFILEPDAEARGIGPQVPDRIEKTDFSGFVALTEATSRIIHW